MKPILCHREHERTRRLEHKPRPSGRLGELSGLEEFDQPARRRRDPIQILSQEFRRQRHLGMLPRQRHLQRQPFADATVVRTSARGRQRQLELIDWTRGGGAGAHSVSRSAATGSGHDQTGIEGRCWRKRRVPASTGVRCFPSAPRRANDSRSGWNPPVS